jgi:hypothetical protein
VDPQVCSSLDAGLVARLMVGSGLWAGWAGLGWVGLGRRERGTKVTVR